MTWTQSDIQKARRVHLAPLLSKRGYSLRKLEYDNFSVDQLPDIIIKHNYWLNKFDRASGNAIDFFMAFENKSFHDAMSILVRKLSTPTPK